MNINDIEAHAAHTVPLPRVKLEVSTDPELEKDLQLMEAAILTLRETSKRIALRGSAMIVRATQTNEIDGPVHIDGTKILTAKKAHNNT